MAGSPAAARKRTPKRLTVTAQVNRMAAALIARQKRAGVAPGPSLPADTVFDAEGWISTPRIQSPATEAKALFRRRRW